MSRPRDRIGISRHGAGWVARVRVNGQLRRRQFPLDTAFVVMQAWRTAQKAKKLGQGTLGDWAKRYTPQIRHMPDAINRTVYLQHWCDALGAHRSVASITPDEINTAMSRWLTEPQPRARGPAKPYAPVTVRHHRTTLLQLWKRLDPTAYNPVVETFRPADPASEARAPSLADVWAVLDKMQPHAKTRARLMLILTTGLPHVQIGRLQLQDWDKARRVLRVTARKKGGGARGRWLVLSTLGHKAMQAFHRADAWGPFSSSAMHSLVARMAKRHHLTSWTPYQLRHLHGTLVYQATGDLATVARLLGHSRLETAQRYAAAAFESVDRAAVTSVAGHITGHFRPSKSAPSRTPSQSRRRKSTQTPMRARSSVG